MEHSETFYKPWHHDTIRVSPTANGYKVSWPEALPDEAKECTMRLTLYEAARLQIALFDNHGMNFFHDMGATPYEEPKPVKPCPMQEAPLPNTMKVGNALYDLKEGCGYAEVREMRSHLNAGPSSKAVDGIQEFCHYLNRYYPEAIHKVDRRYWVDKEVVSKLGCKHGRSGYSFYKMME